MQPHTTQTHAVEDPFDEKRMLARSCCQRETIRCAAPAICELPDDEDPDASFELASDLEQIVAIWDPSSS